MTTARAPRARAGCMHGGALIRAAGKRREAALQSDFSLRSARRNAVVFSAKTAQRGE